MALPAGHARRERKEKDLRLFIEGLSLMLEGISNEVFRPPSFDNLDFQPLNNRLEGAIPTLVLR